MVRAGFAWPRGDGIADLEALGAGRGWTADVDLEPGWRRRARLLGQVGHRCARPAADRRRGAPRPRAVGLRGSSTSQAGVDRGDVAVGQVRRLRRLDPGPRRPRQRRVVGRRCIAPRFAPAPRRAVTSEHGLLIVDRLGVDADRPRPAGFTPADAAEHRPGRTSWRLPATKGPVTPSRRGPSATGPAESTTRKLCPGRRIRSSRGAADGPSRTRSGDIPTNPTTVCATQLLHGAWRATPGSLPR